MTEWLVNLTQVDAVPKKREISRTDTQKDSRQNLKQNL